MLQKLLSNIYTLACYLSWCNNVICFAKLVALFLFLTSQRKSIAKPNPQLKATAFNVAAFYKF